MGSGAIVIDAGNRPPNRAGSVRRWERRRSSVYLRHCRQ